MKGIKARTGATQPHLDELLRFHSIPIIQPLVTTGGDRHAEQGAKHLISHHYTT